MDETLRPLAEGATVLVELIGVVLIVAFVIHALARGLVEFGKRRDAALVVRDVRHRLARGILLGLEFLVAGDIIHTVAVDFDFETVGVLALIVAVRTFLSYSLEVELNGRWPWQADGTAATSADSDGADSTLDSTASRS